MAVLTAPTVGLSVCLSLVTTYLPLLPAELRKRRGRLEHGPVQSDPEAMLADDAEHVGAWTLVFLRLT